MGKPLYTSLLLARHAIEVTAQPEPPKPTYPVVEKWSRWNAFDPDSDEFFESDNAVYEAFLSDEEVAERAQTQHHNARLAERLLREGDTIQLRSALSEDSDHSLVGNEGMDSGYLEVQMQTNEETFIRSTRRPDELRESQESPPPEGQPPRRQPRRTPSISEWRMSSTGEITPSIPHISIVPAGSSEERAFSPDSSTMVSGLDQLSESPRPLIPVDASSPSRPISPIPNTPARVSGVFGTPPSSNPTLTTPSPAPTVTPYISGWGPQATQFAQWAPESPTQLDTSHFFESLLSTSSAPLRF